MTDAQRQALARLRFNSAETPDDVWHFSPSHVDGMHTRALNSIRERVLDAKVSRGASPIGLALQGRKGVGKTHLLGSVRRMVQQEGGYFFLINLTAGEVFWSEVAAAMRTELWRKDDGGEMQLAVLLSRLCDAAAVSASVADAVLGRTQLRPDDLDAFLGALRGVDAQTAVECAETIRALVLYGSPNAGMAGVGHDYFAGWADEKQVRRRWEIRPEPKPARAIVVELSRVLAMTGPSVVAIDQLDSLIDRANNASDDRVTDPVLAEELALIAGGLMQLREATRRTLSIVSCLPRTWTMLHSVAADTFADRFTESPLLGAIVDPNLGRELVAKWLSAVYEGSGFSPPHATWPVASDAFGQSWTSYTPRQLLRRIQAHAEACLHGAIRELTSFDEVTAEKPQEVGPEPAYFADFDRRFADLREQADVAPALDRHSENAVMPEFLHAALRSWITEVGNDDRSWETEPLMDGSNALHAGLRRTLDEEQDLSERWLFRSIARRHGNAVLKQLREAAATAGVRTGSRNRHLVVFHHGVGGWTGAKTREEVTELAESGSPRHEITVDDVRTFSALREMLTHQSYELLNWLVSRKPASRTTILKAILPDPAAARDGDGESRPPPDGEIELGVDGEVRLGLESLRKHAIVFAGSGAGKTVLLRRIVEECALQGVSAIVLDPNNDLARLGDEWPKPPDGWRPGDQERAAEYHSGTDVVVWTPGRSGGRPLSFHPLPDFAGIRDDADEFAAAVEAAVAALVPHARVTGGAKGAVRGQAVLREALTYYAVRGERSLPGFVDVLADLPEGVSKLSTGPKMAADLAETLRAAMVNDPLLGGSGEVVDPGMLLTPEPGRRARVSVISFVGLPSAERQQAFISQLQLEVFAWIKRNPAVDRPLSGLFVMDEAQTIAPSGAWTASTQSTILLASQARKYGLGLLFATQAPKGVHNQVTGNATTQFFGRLNSPAQIAAANELARAKGSSIDDIAQLERGQFYATGETFSFRRLCAALCLSHHPPGPLRAEEVLARAHQGR